MGGVAAAEEAGTQLTPSLQSAMQVSSGAWPGRPVAVLSRLGAAEFLVSKLWGLRILAN